MASSCSRAYVFLPRRRWVAFVLFGISFVLGGLLTLSLLHALRANVEFLSMYGVVALRDGGVWQLLEIVAPGCFAAACYEVFKLCERVLVERPVVVKGIDS
jgi:hypothetical protein